MVYREAVLTNTNNLYFEQKYVKYQFILFIFFYLKIFSFFGGAVVYILNRRIVVMFALSGECTSIRPYRVRSV